MSDVTKILEQIEAGNPSDAARLLPLVYNELRKLAASRMRKESDNHTLQATALVHEAYLRLVDADKIQKWNSRGHFFAAAAEAMRRILVDQARKKNSQRAGGDHSRILFDPIDLPAPGHNATILDLNDALSKFESVDPAAAKLVKLRYFAGMTIPQAAESLDISSSTADRYWAYARAWLHTELKSGD